MPNVGPNVLSGSLHDTISCDNVTVHDKVIETESEATDGASEDMEYANVLNGVYVGEYICSTDCNQDCTSTPPERSLTEYIDPRIN